MLNFWHRAQTSLAWHYPFTRSKTQDFAAAGHGSNYQLAPLFSGCCSTKMEDRQQVIILRRVLSVKYALHQNVNSRLQFKEETYGDLREKLRRERQKLTSFFL